MAIVGESAGSKHADASMDPAETRYRPRPTNYWRIAAAGGIVIAGFLAIAASYALSLQGINPTASDFIGYWVAGRQLVEHANPYDLQAVLQLEKSVGYDGTEPRLTPSPPVALLLLLPLGELSVKTGLFVWTMTQFASLALSLRVLWLLHGRQPTRLHLFGFVFAPAIASLQAGQLGVFLLLSFVLFLYFIPTSPFLAGAVLLPCMLKPHLFVLFLLALILWVGFNRAYRVLAGAALIALASCALTLLFDPAIWTHYVAMTRSATLQDRYTPTLGVAFRLLVAWNAEWPRFVPLAIGCGWALWYFWTRRDHWDWMDQGQLVLLVSVLCSPYAWFTDESVLLPAVLTAAMCARQYNRSPLPIALVAGVALAELASGVKITTWFFLWTGPAWLACYLYGTRLKNSGTQTELQQTPTPASATGNL
jgi:glycosyl transferase family 87